ncbi:MAG: DUF6531 domain-containing protein [Bacteroidetes bacterium]|nr:DUF6531 domain-containing protein [Bacteroidota bacterium]
MPNSYITVPDGANSFQYNGTTYSAGNRFESNNPCELLGFAQAFDTTNPNKGRKDNTPNFWSNLESACPGGQAPPPTNATPNTPNEDNPGNTGGDSANQQGAPTVPQGSSGGAPPENNSDSRTAPTDEPTAPSNGEPHPTHNGEQPQEQTNAGDPVDIFSGAFYLQEIDLTIPNTILPLSFVRFYRSGAASFGPFGWNWDHNFNLFLRELNTGDIALWRNLHEEIFKFDGVTFEPQRGVFEQLERIAGLTQVYEIKGEGGLTMRFERPLNWIDGERIPILWIKDRHGNQLSFSYGAEDKLSEVRDEDDRFFQFQYDQCGLLVSVSDHANRTFQYEHDEQTMQLTCVKSPPISDHPDGITKIYHYEHPWALPELRHNIIRVEDAKGNVYLENTYEQDPANWSYARVTEQLYGGFLYQFQYTQLQWVPANPLYINIPAVRVEVMNPDFGLETYTFNYRGDLLDRRYRLNKDKSYRVVVWQYEFDEQGNPSKTISPDGSEEINIFDFGNADPRMRGKLLQKERTSASGFPSPSRIIWKGKYEPQYQQIKEEINESGAKTTYKYDFDLTPAAANNTGKLIEIIQPDTTLPDGTIQTAKTLFEYNSKGQGTASILPDGTKNESIYGTVGIQKSRLIRQIKDVGKLNIVEQFKYDSFGFLSELTDGNVTAQKINALGLLEKTILPAVNGIEATYILHYDTDKKVISAEKPKGTLRDALITDDFIIDLFERDVLGHPTKYLLSSNTSERRTVKICNDYRGQPIETINPDGSRIRKTFDERGLPLSEEVIGIDGKTISSVKVYGRSGKLIQETNPFGLTTKYKYDGFSRISEISLPNGTKIKNKWFINDLLESEETIGNDGTGIVRQLAFKSYTYDEKNRKTTETVKVFTDNPSVFTPVTTTFYYDNLDRILKTVNSRGGVFTKQYDGLGRVVIEIDPMGNEEHYAYDNNANILKSESHHKEPNGTVSIFLKNYKYDERNRRIELIEPDGAKIISEYDDRNLLVKQCDYFGIIKETSYNSFNDKIQEVNDVGGLNITHRWTVDNMSRIISYIDPTLQITKYFFDSIGRNFKIDCPNGFSSNKTFNNRNQIIKEKLSSGVEFEYKYDTANRISLITNSVTPASVKKVENHEFSYDGLDRVLSAKVDFNSVFRLYDSRSRLLSETTLGDTIWCKYNDINGDVEKIWSDGRTETLRHDLNGILVQIEQTANGALGTANALLATFQPSGPNLLGVASYLGGTKITPQYDERKRLTEISIQSPIGANETIKYRYNKANQKQVEAIFGQNAKISYFEFDNQYRLSTAKDGFGSSINSAVTQAEHDNSINQVNLAAFAASHQEQFSYNLADARTKYTETGNPDKNYTFFAGHKIQNDGFSAYTFHLDGTLKSDGSIEYEVDALGRIVTIKAGFTVLTTIDYDAFSRPSIIKEFGKPDKSFNYFGGFIEQENESGNVSRQITLQPATGVPIAYHSAIGTNYTLFDGRFNLIGLMDANGFIVETYRYKSFGKPQVFDQTGNASPDSPFGVTPIFGGQRYLDVTGLYLSKRRLMNPVNGVFLAADPKGYLDSPSLYVYAAQDPINNNDPNGEIIPFIIAAFVIAGATAGAGYSVYDAYQHPEKYEGAAGVWRPLVNTFGGAAIGGVSIVAAEGVLAVGGVGVFAAEGTTVTLTAAQTFGLYGTASAVGGGIGRYGFNNLFPEYIDPVSGNTIATDFIIGGAVPVVGSALRPMINGAGQMISRSINGPWRAFGNNWRLFSNPRTAYSWRNIFSDSRTYNAISKQYWRGQANGNSLQHLWSLRTNGLLPQRFRNAGWNLLEVPRTLNTWMGDIPARNYAFRGIVGGILTGTGLGSYFATDALLDSDNEASESNGNQQIHPNEKPPSSK